MAIQKKSLISNRTATKKALVAKPEVSNNPAVTRSKVTRLHLPDTKVAIPTRIKLK